MSLQKMFKGYVTAGDLIDKGNSLIDLAIKSKRKIRSGKRLKLIAFGDSITDFGDGSARASDGAYSMYAQGYWVCATMWSKNKFDVLDGKGISTQTTVNMLSRVADVTNSGADICLIMAGTNDLGVNRTPEETRDTMQQIVDAITSAGIAVAITPVLHRSDKSINTAIDKLNGYYSDIAADSKDVVLLDAGYSFNDYIDSSEHQAVSIDRLHPNAFGAWILGKEVALGLDDNFNSWDFSEGIFSNYNLDGAAGALSNGATGSLPDGINGEFCNYKSIVDLGERKILATVSKSSKALLSIENVAVSSGSRYVAVATVEIPSTFGFVDSGCFISIENQSGGGIASTAFTPDMVGLDGDSIQFEKVEVSTPYFEVKTGISEVKMTLSFETDAQTNAEIKMSNIKIIEL